MSLQDTEEIDLGWGAFAKVPREAVVIIREPLERQVAMLREAASLLLSKQHLSGGCECNPPGAGDKLPEDPMSYDSGYRCRGNCYLRAALAAITLTARRSHEHEIRPSGGA